MRVIVLCEIVTGLVRDVQAVRRAEWRNNKGLQDRILLSARHRNRKASNAATGRTMEVDYSMLSGDSSWL